MIWLLVGLMGGVVIGYLIAMLHNRGLRDAFGALSNEALRNNNQSFLDLAQVKMESWQAAIQPVTDTLGKFEGKLGELEKSRVASSIR